MNSVLSHKTNSIMLEGYWKSHPTVRCCSTTYIEPSDRAKVWPLPTAIIRLSGRAARVNLIDIPAINAMNEILWVCVCEFVVFAHIFPLSRIIQAHTQINLAYLRYY